MVCVKITIKSRMIPDMSRLTVSMGALESFPREVKDEVNWFTELNMPSVGQSPPEELEEEAEELAEQSHTISLVYVYLVEHKPVEQMTYVQTCRAYDIRLNLSSK